MTSLQVVGGTGADGLPLDVVIDDGRISSVASDGAPSSGERYDATGLTVLPGWVDLQVNGASGIDVTREPERLWELAAAMPAHGVTAFLPTVITSAAAQRDRAIEVLQAGPPPGWQGAIPLGLHFEGPMIAEARKGAHPPQWLAAPSPDLVAGWSAATGVAMVTIAPELPGALDVIDRLVAAGVVVALGHTDATAEQMTAAVDRGARVVTHLGNAMPPLQGRAPGPVGAALADPRLVAGVIADGHHLASITVAAFRAALGDRRFLVVTDCTAALGMPDGPARLGDQEVDVRDGAVRLADGTLAGSSADLAQCLRGLRAATGCDLASAVAGCTTVPADVLDDPGRGRIAAGTRGDLTLVDAHLDVVATIIGGRILHGGA